MWNSHQPSVISCQNQNLRDFRIFRIIDTIGLTDENLYVLMTGGEFV